MKRHLCILTGLSLALASVTVRQADAATPPPAAGEEPDTLAKQAFREQRYPEAAEQFEQLWSEKGVPKYLYNAAMAREMMGDELQAFVHLHTFLGLPGQPEAELVKVQDRIRTLKGRTIKLRVRVAPADLPEGALALDARRGDGNGGATAVRLDAAALASLAVPGAPGAYDLPVEAGLWDLEFVSDGFGPGRISVRAAPGPAAQLVVKLERLGEPMIDVTVELGPANALNTGIDVSLQGPSPAPEIRERMVRSPFTWHIKPGVWTLDANAADYESARRVFTAGEQPIRLQVQLKQKRREGRRLALGLGVAGGATVVAGTVLLSVAMASLAPRRDRDLLSTTEVLFRPQSDKETNKANKAAWNTAREGWSQNWRVANAGAGLLGAGLGMGISSVTALASRRRSYWVAEIVVGTATGVGMVVAYSLDSVKTLAKDQAAIRDLADATMRVAWDADLEEDATDGFSRARRSGAAFSLLLGIGTGLALGGVTGLIHDRKSKQRPGTTRLTPFFDKTGAGAFLQHRF